MLDLFALILLLPPYVEYAGYVLSETLAEAMLVAGLAGLFFGYSRRGQCGLLYPHSQWVMRLSPALSIRLQLWP